MKKDKAATPRMPFQPSYHRRIDSSLIPVCNIMGVGIAAINMQWLLDFIPGHLKEISGDYICVANVHTTVTAFENEEYMRVQNGGLMSIPDGGPLTSIGKKRGFQNMARTTGPAFMLEILKISAKKGYRHYFYGATEDTLKHVRHIIETDYPGVTIAGMYSPPFRELTEEEEAKIAKQIQETKPDYIWVALGAPKQEVWMAKHQGTLPGLMVGVGAGFDFFVGNIKRAPRWMQRLNLEWLYRLMQDPIRLFPRYWHTNTRFIYHAIVRGR